MTRLGIVVDDFITEFLLSFNKAGRILKLGRHLAKLQVRL